MGDSGTPIHQSPTMATVVAIHNSPDDIDALHDAGKLVEPLMKRRVPRYVFVGNSQTASG
jgi:hypothetical protein